MRDSNVFTYSVYYINHPLTVMLERFYDYSKKLLNGLNVEKCIYNINNISCKSEI